MQNRQHGSSKTSGEVIDRFLAAYLIKEELMTDFHLIESDDLKQSLARYVDFYNTERPAYSLWYMTPRMFYKTFLDGRIEHRDTFSNRELSEVPKFVRRRLEEG